VTYHETGADATAGLPLIASPTAYTNQTAYFDTIWVRVVSNSSNCAAIRPLNLVVNDAPIDVAQVPTPLIICDDLGLVNDGFSIFNLSLKDAEIAQGNSNVTISYYPSPADAAAGTNQITDPTAYPNISNPQTLGVVVTDNSTGCQAFTILTIEVKPNPTPYPNAIDPLTACDGDQDGSALFDLTSYDGLILSTDAASDITGYFTSYDDAVNDVNDINDTGDPANFVNTSNPQTIWVRVENLLTGCFELVSFDLYNPLPLVNLTADKTILCIDATGVAIPGSEPILDTGLDPALYTFVWDVDGNVLPDTGASITASVPGTYTVTVSNANGDGCFNTASITITTSSAPLSYSANVTSVAFAENHTIEATASGNSTYVFSLDGGPFQDSGIFENVAPGLHYVTIRDVNGCGEIVLEVCVIDYPKYFTPNADTYHDTWNITGGTCGNITKLYIFDRYGKLLKQLDPNGAGWDGTYNGTLLPSTDYWFKLSYIEDGVEKEFANHFAMKR
jgi:gliding motility-associated-like protein